MYEKKDYSKHLKCEFLTALTAGETFSWPVKLHNLVHDTPVPGMLQYLQTELSTVASEEDSDLTSFNQTVYATSGVVSRSSTCQDDSPLYFLATTKAVFVKFHVRETGARLPAGPKLLALLTVWCQTTRLELLVHAHWQSVIKHVDTRQNKRKQFRIIGV